MRLLAVWLLACSLPLAAQRVKNSKDSVESRESAESKEERDLEDAVAEAGSSPIEYAHALVRHLQKYPDSKQRPEIERVIVQAAIDARNKKLIATYGVAVLERGSDDPSILESVSRALLDRDDPATAEKALKYSRKLEQALEVQYKRALANGAIGKGVRLEDIQIRLGRSQVFQARALGLAGKLPEAVEAARKGYATYPTSEAAHELAKWLDKSGQSEASLPFFAEAFALAPSEALRVRERQNLGEVNRKVKGSDAGLGDLLLAAFDNTQARVAAVRARMKESDPNVGAVAPYDFTLGALEGPPLVMSSLKGKVVILDFWATWCGPCRAQHPLLEQLRARFKDNPDVVFLAIDTDEDREVVGPFLDAQKWDKRVYFEDGLQAALRVNSIPTIVILDRQGGIYSRLNGFIPDRFIDMMTTRINEALAEK